MVIFFLPLLAAYSFGSPVFAAPNYSTDPPTNDSNYPSNGDCIDYTIKETITATEYIWAVPRWKDNFDVATFLFSLARKDAQSQPQPLNGTKEVTADYEVSGTFCSPKERKSRKESTVLLATHGLGYDKQYWASTYKPEEYSFVDNVLAAGYSVFYYDRIGTGKSGLSAPVSGYENQASNQVEMIKKIAQSIKDGKNTGDIKAEKVVLVGHSFGSFVSNGVLSSQPDLVDGAVLTGIAYPNMNDGASKAFPWLPSAFAARIGSTLSPKYTYLDTGYVGFGDIYSHTETFFSPNFDVETVKYGQSISHPLGVVELLTLGRVDLSSPNFKGKVLVTVGEFDFIICGGECYSTFETGRQNDTFSGAHLETYIHDGAAHGVNFGKNASGFYAKIIDFLDRNF